MAPLSCDMRAAFAYSLFADSERWSFFRLLQAKNRALFLHNWKNIFPRLKTSGRPAGPYVFHRRCKGTKKNNTLQIKSEKKVNI